MKGPEPNSNTSKKRANRGFKSLEQSSRKHRRALRRSENSRIIGGKLYKPGEKVDRPFDGGKLQSFQMTAGGSLKYN